MNIEEIRKNKPDGATHYHEYRNMYYMQKGTDVWRWIGKWLYLSNCERGDLFVLGMHRL